MWKVHTRPTSASDFLSIKSRKTWKFAIIFFLLFASETNTIQISYVESNTSLERKKFPSGCLGAASSAVLSARKLEFWLPHQILGIKSPKTWKFAIKKKLQVKPILSIFHLWKVKMGSPSVCPSVRLSPISRPVWHLESWNFEHKSVGVCVSIVRSGILDPWPRSPGFGP
jgi:hypothetical protein